MGTGGLVGAEAAPCPAPRPQTLPLRTRARELDPQCLLGQCHRRPRRHAPTRAHVHADTRAHPRTTCTHVHAPVSMYTRTLPSPRPGAHVGLTAVDRQSLARLDGTTAGPPWPWSPSSCGARATGLLRGALPWPSPGSVAPARPEAGSPDARGAPAAPLTSPSSQVPVCPD